MKRSTKALKSKFLKLIKSNANGVSLSKAWKQTVDGACLIIQAQNSESTPEGVESAVRRALFLLGVYYEATDPQYFLKAANIFTELSIASPNCDFVGEFFDTQILKRPYRNEAFKMVRNTFKENFTNSIQKDVLSRGITMLVNLNNGFERTIASLEVIQSIKEIETQKLHVETNCLAESELEYDMCVLGFTLLNIPVNIYLLPNGSFDVSDAKEHTSVGNATQYYLEEMMA